MPCQDHKADHGSNDSHTRKLKKHYRLLMVVPMRLFSPIPNPAMEFDKRVLSARGYIRNCYLGKVALCAMSS